jgi:hypothetical protein
LGKESAIEIESQNPGQMSAERCEEENQRQRSNECEDENVVNQYASSHKSLKLAHHTGYPVP